MENESVNKNLGEAVTHLVQTRISRKAIAGFTCGLLGFLFFLIVPLSILLGILAIILSSIALSQIKRNKYTTGTGLGVAGLVLGIIDLVVIGIIGTLIFIAIAIPSFMTMSNKGKESSVKANMHTVQLTIEDWSTLSNGRYPTSMGDIATSSRETFSELFPGAMTNPFTNEPLNIKFMTETEPFPTEYEQITIPPGEIYIFCNGIKYVILGGGKDRESLPLHLTNY